jgi:hypothetical protein
MIPENQNYMNVLKNLGLEDEYNILDNDSNEVAEKIKTKSNEIFSMFELLGRGDASPELKGSLKALSQSIIFSQGVHLDEGLVDKARTLFGERIGITDFSSFKKRIFKELSSERSVNLNLCIAVLLKYKKIFSSEEGFSEVVGKIADFISKMQNENNRLTGDRRQKVEYNSSLALGMIMEFPSAKIDPKKLPYGTVESFLSTKLDSDVHFDRWVEFYLEERDWNSQFSLVKDESFQSNLFEIFNRGLIQPPKNKILFDLIFEKNSDKDKYERAFYFWSSYSEDIKDKILTLYNEDDLNKIRNETRSDILDGKIDSSTYDRFLFYRDTFSKDFTALQELKDIIQKIFKDVKESSFRELATEISLEIDGWEDLIPKEEEISIYKYVNNVNVEKGSDILINLHRRGIHIQFEYVDKKVLNHLLTKKECQVELAEKFFIHFLKNKTLEKLIEYSIDSSFLKLLMICISKGKVTLTGEELVQLLTMPTTKGVIEELDQEIRISLHASIAQMAVGISEKKLFSSKFEDSFPIGDEYQNLFTTVEDIVNKGLNNVKENWDQIEDVYKEYKIDSKITFSLLNDHWKGILSRIKDRASHIGTPKEDDKEGLKKYYGHLLKNLAIYLNGEFNLAFKDAEKLGIDPSKRILSILMSVINYKLEGVCERRLYGEIASLAKMHNKGKVVELGEKIEKKSIIPEILESTFIGYLEKTVTNLVEDYGSDVHIADRFRQICGLSPTVADPTLSFDDTEYKIKIIKSVSSKDLCYALKDAILLRCRIEDLDEEEQARQQEIRGEISNILRMGSYFGKDLQFQMERQMPDELKEMEERVRLEEKAIEQFVESLKESGNVNLIMTQIQDLLKAENFLKKTFPAILSKLEEGKMVIIDNLIGEKSKLIKTANILERRGLQGEIEALENLKEIFRLLDIELAQQGDFLRRISSINEARRAMLHLCREKSIPISLSQIWNEGSGLVGHLKRSFDQLCRTHYIEVVLEKESEMSEQEELAIFQAILFSNGYLENVDFPEFDIL